MIYKFVLFDLDGTLLDSAEDILIALNCLRDHYNRPQNLKLEEIKPYINSGSGGLIEIALGIKKEKQVEEWLKARELFFIYYEEQLNHFKAKLFPEVKTLLNHLEEVKLPWGIVTNKIAKHVLPTLALFSPFKPHCIVFGDTLQETKPHPKPLIYASACLKNHPQDGLYFGDSNNDVTASLKAGMHAFVAMYGYLSLTEPQSWGAKAYISHPLELLEYL